MSRAVFLFALYVALSLVFAPAVRADAILGATCGNTTNETAQEILRIAPSDPNGLDPDGNGIACDEPSGTDPCPDPNYPRETPDGCEASDLPDVDFMGLCPDGVYADGECLSSEESAGVAATSGFDPVPPGYHIGKKADDPCPLDIESFPVGTGCGEGGSYLVPNEATATATASATSAASSTSTPSNSASATPTATQDPAADEREDEQASSEERETTQDEATRSEEPEDRNRSVKQTPLPETDEASKRYPVALAGITFVGLAISGLLAARAILPWRR